ncbi:MAG: protein-L-isoaspartate(D-aspartate) O-methyltransferase [Deltaproteobacteria bacterium]|nr:protein-L-isoaspartate(D-aspartate) O-methyltransferase [Deltaproteobacteria bacterium]
MGCQRCAGAPRGDNAVTASLDSEQRFAAQRDAMVSTQIERRGVKDHKVLDAMRKVKRHLFVLERDLGEAYDDHPLPIGLGQTISQPYIVGWMTEALGLKGGEKVLEIGSGSGYQAAVLAEIAGRVFTIEIVPELAERSSRALAAMGYANVSVKAGDGYRGWPDEAPFDGIMVTAAPPRVPEPLKEQLKVGARLVVPVGEGWQELQVITRTQSGFVTETAFPVSFVPMTGEAQKK